MQRHGVAGKLARMELHCGRCSGNSSRALFGLEEIGAPFDAVLVDAFAGKNREPGYLAIDPMGKVSVGVGVGVGVGVERWRWA
ncbi:MAG: hypothetical protein JST92_15970, partial [Deltaproteobacteria bacterium]|nr:hypothetical protein [Deltaproteobacteria bacterium]